MNLIRLCLLLSLCAALSGCSAMQGIGLAKGLIGSETPSVDATAQVGAENTQEGDSVVDAGRDEDRRVDASDNTGVSNVTQQESGVSNGDWTAGSISIEQIPPLFLFLFALGWVLPGPDRIFKGIGKGILFIRKVWKGEI